LTPGGSRPSIGGGPTQLPGGRPNIGAGPSQLPGGGVRPGGGRQQISTLPSTRPDFGGRPGTGSRPGISTLPAVGAGAIAGAGLANRIGDRPGTLPGLGDRRPGASQLPANRTPEQRREALHDRLGGENRPGQQPARDWNQTRQDWQQNRDQIREDWQQHRDEGREDWQNFFDDHYGRYGGWYGGYAPGYWGRWDYLWDSYPVAAAVGLTWWGVNSLGSVFGCGDYANPYYAESMPVYYSEPVVTLPLEAAPDTGQSALPPGVSQEAVTTFDQARAAFLEGKYDEALKLTDKAVAQMPRDAVLHEFRSLVLFALKRYAESAATIHPVLAVGPGWDWKTLSGLYPDTDTYTAQLRALEAARDKDPKAPYLRFLTGYHYLTLGYQDDALGQFRRALELQPKDTVTAALVASLSPRDAQPAQVVTLTAPKPVPADTVTGAWSASGKGTAKYSMSLQKDGTFTWDFSRGSKKEQVKGVYTLEGNVLAMEPDGGGVMLAEVTLKGPDALHFKMIGGATDDPGLAFRRG
jgi:tetratricopeptide (TPR) repeat protein